MVFAQSEQKQRPKGALRRHDVALSFLDAKSGVMPPHSMAAGAACVLFDRFGSRPQKQRLLQKLHGIGRDARGPLLDSRADAEDPVGFALFLD